jgi:DNA-binding transcriptional MocR family regulator
LQIRNHVSPVKSPKRPIPSLLSNDQKPTAQLHQGFLQIFRHTRHWESRWWYVEAILSCRIFNANQLSGLPNAHYFPYDTLEASVARPNRWKPTPNDSTSPPTDKFDKLDITEDPGASRIVVPHNSSASNILRKIDLTTALQYGTAQGYPPLYSFIRQFALEHLHPNIPYKDGAEIVLTNGSTDGFSKSLEAFTNTWHVERDWIREREGMVCEEFVYMAAVQAGRPRGLNVVAVAIDEEGMLASGKGGLADVLENWDKNKGKRPHLMYTVT